MQQVAGQAHFRLRAELTGVLPAGAQHVVDGRGRRQLIFRAHLAEGSVQGAVEKVVNHAPVTEAHFVLGRVDVDIDGGRVDLQKQHKGRMPTIEQHVAVGLAHGMGDQLIAHHAAVNVEILQVGLAAREGRQPHPTPQMQAIALDLDRQRLLEKRRTTDRRHPPRTTQVIGRLMQRQHALAVVAQMKSHIEARQGQTADHFLQVLKLGLLSFEKLAPRRRVEEQVAHLHRGAHRMGRRLHARGHVAAFGLHLPGLLGLGGARGQGQAGHRTDRGQGLTTKAQAQHLLQIFQLANLAGGMSRQGQRQVIGGNAAAVVTHPQQLAAALLDVHLDAPSAGVQAVFQQLLDHRGGPFNHLAGGDLVGQARAQQLNTHGVAHGCAANAVLGIFRV